MGLVYFIGGIVVLAGLVLVVTHVRSVRDHGRLRARLEPWLVERGFVSRWGDSDGRSYNLPLFDDAPQPEIRLGLHDTFLVLEVSRRLSDDGCASEARVRWPYVRRDAISGDPVLDAVLCVERDDGGAGLLLLLAGAERRAALAGLLDAGPTPGPTDRTVVRVGGGRLELAVWQSGGVFGPGRVEAGLERLIAAARVLLPGFDARIADDLARVADDDALAPDLRHRARRLLATDWPASDAARRAAPALLGDPDPALALRAALIVDDTSVMRARLCGLEPGAEPTGRPLSDPWLELLTALYARLSTADPALDWTQLSHRGVRQGWLRVALRAGHAAPLLAALDAEEAPAIRGELVRIVADAPALSDALFEALVGLLTDAEAASGPAALELARRGDHRALLPLATWRAGRPAGPTTEQVERGMARIRADLDPAMAGRLALSGGGGGGLSLDPPPEG